MSDIREIIQRKFQPEHRYANYGNILTRVHIQGLRCHRNTFLEVKSPITALCGLNGTGKSTLLQAIAVAYKSSDPQLHPHYNISDFIITGTLDPQPFSIDARIEYQYWQENRETKTTTLARKSNQAGWNGYQRRPQRIVFFTGAGLYLPKIEQRDFVVRYARRLVVSNTQTLSTEIKQWTSKILSCNYDELVSNTVLYQKESRQRTSEVVCAERDEVKYSETNMGYGEARTQFLITTLEKLPSRSLILIEEPETSLHPSAQFYLGQYLLDVVNRKNHQIFLTTHSMFILGAMPSASTVYLSRMRGGINIERDLSPLEVRSRLAEGHVKALTILVEDDCAEAILRAILMLKDRNFIRGIDICRGGDANTIANAVKTLKETKLSVACVRDADKGPDARNNIFSLPGTLPPEKELFASSYVRAFIRSTYGVELGDFETSLIGTDHHQWLERLARYINHSQDALLNEMAQAYVRSLSENDIDTLVTLLKEATNK